ncbi:hypothetical protein [Delftia sp. Cs1-4]|uniref:hypothetical protein n=1 Tax=Delftia sp. (strain Cs1-4) TaxID=742013 RepID=UPI0012F520E7|nr:hypothetical protein [Delftia sp. Cs1-4]
MGTEREHLLLGGAEEAKLLPFARGRVRTLRAAGFRHITQRYKLLDMLVRVTLAGDDAWIEIQGGRWDYLVWPTSLDHGLGVHQKDGQEISPLCAMTLNASDKGLRRKENVDLLAGPHDWISDDHKEVLTYDHGNGFRYAITGAQHAGMRNQGRDLPQRRAYQGAPWGERLRDLQGLAAPGRHGEVPGPRCLRGLHRLHGPHAAAARDR